MAISQNPLTGQMKKSMGNFSTYTLNKQNVVRSKAFNRKDANSEAQQVHRSGFKLLVNEFQSLATILEKGLLNRPEGVSVYNQFFALNLPRILDSTGDAVTLRFEDMTVSSGPVGKVRDTVATVIPEGLSVTFNTGLKNPNAFSTDVLYAFLKTKDGDVVLESQPRGSEQTGTILLDYPGIKKEDIAYCYLFLTNADGTKASDTVFVAVE
ncbi:hypothetical protein [Parabacteroides sp. FAFU027]|uniref:hypothetical protein n=1 Tax=Parabacteroides sp. FAFU027 TaxID=2922715 RepID=UPI001FAF0D5F|nr:hypothetical protein [Parabacteroides sp. FAFU027]